MADKAQKGALDGIRVLDFTQMMLGPLCTQTLADMGADVIKIERPGKGEWIRSMPMIGEFVGDDSAAFHSFNRNKRSVTVDLKNPKGRELLLKLAETCDVVVENFRSGVMDRLGFGYEDFRKVNDKIIYASGSGWGEDSYLAKKGWPGQDLLIQAMSGVMQNTGRASEPPTACGTPIADFAASQALAIGILGALIARDRHGVGQKVETNLYSATLNLMAQENFAVLNQGIELERSEAGIASCWNDAPYGSYPTADGWVAIAMCPLDKLGELLGDETLGSLDPWQERDEAKRQIETLTSQKTTAEIMEIFEGADVWAAPIRSSAEAMQELIDLNSPRLVEMEHPKAGRIRAIANPITLSETPVTLRYVPPTVGQHTDEVLKDLLDEDELPRTALTRCDLMVEERLHPNLVLERQGFIEILRVDREEALGALNFEIMEAIGGYVAALPARIDEVRVLIITGTGRGFVAGADIGGYHKVGQTEFDGFQRRSRQTFDAIANLPQITICAVNGYALGGGLELAICCDFVFVNDKTKLGLPEVKLGLLPGGGGTQRLPRIVGAMRAKDIMLTGRMITALEAVEYGIALESCKPDDLMPRALEYARTLGEQAPVALRELKRIIDDGMDCALSAGLTLEQRALGALFATSDGKEGIAAFIEKREPEFVGK